MKRLLFSIILLSGLFYQQLRAQVTYTANSGGYAYLDNGTYKIGFKLDYGGAIDYLSKSNEDNSLVNSADNGRQVGIDAYNGPSYNQSTVYKDQGYIDACESAGILCSTTGSNWNGLPQGCYDGQTGGAPTSISWNSSTQTLTIVSKLWDWLLREQSNHAKVYDQADQTQEITFVSSNVFKVKYTTNMHISYLTGTYTGNQVSPFMYLNGAFVKSASYIGSSPFTNDANVYNQVIPYHDDNLNLWGDNGKEKWAGLYNTSDYGVGMVWTDDQLQVVAGTNGPNNPDNSRYSGKANYMYHINLPNPLTGSSTIVNEVWYVMGSPNDARCLAYTLNGHTSTSCGIPPTCDFNMSASASNANPAVNTSVTLSSSCSGTNCSGLTYSWSGNGISGTGSSVTFNAPSTAGTYTYTLTTSKSGCTSKTSTVQLNVTSESNPCNFTEKGVIGTWQGNDVQTRQFTVNGSTVWLIVTVPSGATDDKHFPRGANFSERTDVSWTNGAPSKSCFGGGDTDWGGLSLPANITVPSGYSQGTEPDGAIFFHQSCSAPSAPGLSASPSSITSGSSSTLSASGCSGGTITWSNGLGTGTSKSVSPTSTTTYTATCTIGSCTSSNGSVTVTVNPPSGVDCNALWSDFNGANCAFIEGWIYDQSHPNTSLNVDVYEGSTLLVSNAPANVFRQDLLNAGLGNGYHGFAVATPSALKDGQSHSLTIKASDCTYTLNNCPKSLNSCSGGPLMLDPAGADAAGSAGSSIMLTVTPNPNNGVMDAHFYVERGKTATLIVSDLQGHILYKKSIAGQGVQSERIAISGASGLLTVQLIKESRKEVKKITIVK